MTYPKAPEIRKSSDDVLRALIQEQRAKIVELTVKKHTAGLKNARETRAIKKHIARIMTVLGERKQ